MTLTPRIPVTRGQIAAVVAEFYDRVRNHTTLGPVFASHVADWPKHEAKITSFWCNALLHERSYDGNPMQVHINAGNVHGGHFKQWLPLFDAVLADILSPDLAQSWSALAHRIGRGLQFGLESHGGVPMLR